MGPDAHNASDLADAIAAFFADLGAMAGKVTLVTISEFGRRVTRERQLRTRPRLRQRHVRRRGGRVGGRYYGTLARAHAPSNDADLLVTTDYRSVLAEVVSTRFNADVSRVFPGFVREPVGVMRA